MKVILFNNETERFQERLKQYAFDYESNHQRLKERIKDYEGLIAFGLDQTIDLSNIKWIQSLGAGVDWAVNNPSLKENTVITRVTKGLEQELFEYTLTRILYYYQNVDYHLKNQQKNLWQRKLSTSITDKKVLIIGTGKIGSYIGTELSRLKMNVYGVNSSGYDILGFKQCYTFTTIDKSIKYDVVVNVLPSTPQTINVFEREFFNEIKMDVFINIGRGNAVVVEDLVEKLEANQIKMAFLDVFQEEPLKSESQLWQTNNLILTPHIAGVPNFEQLIESITTNYKRVVKGKKIEDAVNIKKGY